MASSPKSQQVVSERQDNQNLYELGWGYVLNDSTILDLHVFRSFFSVAHRPDVDIIVICQEGTNNACGFGFVANEKSSTTGGIFRTEADTATRLRNSLFGLAVNLSNIHTSSHPQSHMGESVDRRNINYIQFSIPSHLRDHQFSSYFNTFPACSFSVVALFEERPSGFGFLENPPEDSYMNQYKSMVEELKMIISGGLATVPRSFLGQGVGSRMTYGVQLQQQSGGRGREISGSSLGQGVIGSRMAHSVQQQQRMGERGRGSAATELAQIPRRFLGQGGIGSRMAHSVQQQQRGERGRGSAASEVIFNTSLITFDFQPTDGMPHAAASNTPSSAPWWSGFQASPSYVVGSAAVTAQSLSGSISGGYPNPTQWPGSNNVAGQSYAVMQQQPQSYIHSQLTAGVFPHEAVNRPSSAHMWSGPSAGVTYQVLSARSASQLQTNQWSGSIFRGGYSNTLMQQQQQQQPGPSILSQSTDTTSGSFFGDTDQIFAGSFAGGQPTTGQWSRAVGANRPVQNSTGDRPVQNSTGESSSVYYPEYDMWKKK